MPFTEHETTEILSHLEKEFWAHHRPPLHLREQVREGQRIENQSIELFLIRPAFQKKDEWTEDSIAKIRYIRSHNVWKIYWKRADTKWHPCQPNPQKQTLPAALAVISKVQHNCFFG